MKHSIFYSWQSDLPSSTNRSFIENCIKKSIKQLKNNFELEYHLSLDRDTQNEMGSPNITDTIFTKINKSKIFIADISFINKGSKFKKTPNPNVLIELGFASKAIGWERIICLFNTDYGNLKDLPFNIRQHRPLTYSTKNKEINQNKIIGIITQTYINLNNSGKLDDIIDDYLKLQVDTEILTCINYLIKIVYGYDHEITLKNISEFIKLSDNKINELLRNRKILGFQLFKVWDVNENKLKEIAEKSIISDFYNKELGRSILEIMKWVSIFSKTIQEMLHYKSFEIISAECNEYKVIKGTDINRCNDEYPNRYLLLKTIDKTKGVVIDFGDFITKDSIEMQTNLLKMNSIALQIFTSEISQFNKLINHWLLLTNGNFIIDNVKDFKIYPHSKKV